MNDSWIEDRKLKEEIKKYVSQGLRREEILDYLKKDFSQYAKVSLSRRCKTQFERNSMVLANYWDIDRSYAKQITTRALSSCSA